MPTTNKTVILGEAPESDSEEISLDDEEIQLDTAQDELNHQAGKNQAFSNQADIDIFEGTSTLMRESDGSRSVLGSSLLASIGSACGITRLVNYNLLTPGNQSLLVVSEQTQTPETIGLSQLPPLHKNLYTKNCQLYASMNHLYNHPYEKACKDLHTISQRLVGVQKLIQDVETAVINFKREQKHLETLQICLLPDWQETSGNDDGSAAF